MYHRRPQNYRAFDNYRGFGEQPRLVEIQLGYALIPLVQEEHGELLLPEIAYSRNLIDTELGIPVPKIHIRDNFSIKPFEEKFQTNTDCYYVGEAY